jgi:hypothetical protein
LRRVLAARGIQPKFNRLIIAEWLSDPNRKPQAAEARRLGLTTRQFRRIVRELEADISKFI